jgi:hypothetical protein
MPYLHVILSGGDFMTVNGYTLNPAIGDEDVEEYKALQKGVKEQVKTNLRRGATVDYQYILSHINEFYMPLLLL